MVLLSCNNNSKEFTPEKAKEIIINCNSKTVKTNLIFLGERGYTLIDANSIKEFNYMTRLHKEGYILLDSLYTKDVGGRISKIVSVYNVKLTDKAKPFILKEDTGNVSVKSYETIVIAVKKLETINENKMKALVNYEKIKTPFYEEQYDTSLLKNESDSFNQTIFLIKGNSNEWRCSSR